jgi:hypothetical protein
MPLPSFVRRLRRRQSIVVVSGLPRSGTSMMMRMLAAGGVPVLSDDARPPDAANPAGYFEFAPVKELASGGAPAWLEGARGKAVKIVSFLLTWLPESHDYRVIFMRRDLGEVVASQQAMLAARGESVDENGDRLAGVYADHLERIARFLAGRPCFSVLDIEYRSVIDRPADAARRVAAFLERDLDATAMAAAVDASLYRHRRG